MRTKGLGSMANEWDDFGQQPGTHLWWARTGAVRRELYTAEQQTVACLRYGLRTTVSTGGRTFTWKPVAGSSRPGIAEIVRRAHGEGGPGPLLVGGPPHYPAVGPLRKLRKLLDDTGTSILYTSGRNFDHYAGACITFPDGRLFRFPVRGTRLADAVMIAVDQGGNEVARYRVIGRGFFTWPVEIIVHPGKQLTDELALAIVISAPWLNSYFARNTGGGG
jgi:hypothetical protein